MSRALKSFSWFQILVVIAFVGFAMLGHWQIVRAQFKTRMVRALAHQGQTIDFKDVSQLNVEYHRLTVKNGQWHTGVFVLDNQIQEHQVGYRTYRLLCEQSSCLLVRGPWYAKDKKRKDINDDSHQLRGLLRPVPISLIRHKESDMHTGALILASLDTGFLEQHFNVKLLPYEFILEKYNDLDLFKSRLTIHRHYAYALQFYLLAFVVVVGYIFI